MTPQGKVKPTPCTILGKILSPMKSVGKCLISLVQTRSHPCVFLVIMGTFQEITETNEIFVLENSLLKNLRLKIKDLSLKNNTEASSKFCA